MSTQHASARGHAIRTCGAMLLMSLSIGGVAHADCNWPQVSAIEERHREPIVVGGVAFVSERYSYHLPSYRIASVQCSPRIDWGPRSWSWSFGGQTTPLHERKGKASPNRSLPPLPALPPLPSIPDLPPLPPVPPL